MEYFPIAINLHDKPCLVVGGGSVALRKVSQLVEFGAVVTVVSPTVEEGFKPLGVRVVLREFETQDLDGAFLVVTATDDPALNQRILTLCNARNLLCNSATNPCDDGYIFPSVARRDGITVGVTTDGISPYVSKLVREEIQGEVLPKYAKALELSKRLRKTVPPSELKTLIELAVKR